MKRQENIESKKKKVRQVLKLVRQGMNVTEACQQLKISKPSYYHWKRWVESLDIEKHNFIDMYAKRLQRELQNQINYKKLIKTMFQKEDKKSGRHPNTYIHQLTSKQIYQILSKLQNGHSYREVASMYDTSHTTIAKIYKEWEIK